MNIVGISAHFHDAACCLLQDGRLVAAAEEERFTRIKHDASLPRNAFRYCLEAGGIDLLDVDCIAYFEDPAKKLGRQLWMSLPAWATGQRLQGLLDGVRVEREIRQLLGYEGPIKFYDHHQSHAASSFLYSGFHDAAILTVDGVGEWATMTYGRGEGSAIELFEEVEFPSSIGLLYSAVTSYLGFSVNDAEYKVMGLAPYGRPAYLAQCRQLIADHEDGRLELDARYFDFFTGGPMFTPALAELFGAPARVPESAIEAFHQDVARSLQELLEEVLLAKCAYLHRLAPSENLCMAGGVALNCVANGKILRHGPFRRLFVQPAASDAGSALGAAALAHVELTGRRHSDATLTDVSLGPSSDGHAIRAFLADAGIAAADFRGAPDRLVAAAADRLAAQQVLGWFHGRMEFGPRALGNRSILADPRNPEMRDRINALVKKREAFRPFAPSVLAERAAEHFDLDHASPFMLETCQVISALDLPAITHVDRSARVQTVTREANPRYHALLAAFAERTGCPLVLNTSFNLRGEPIVLTPLDALWCFVRSDLDALVLGDFLIERADLTPHWLALREAADARPPTRESFTSHLVYTFF